MLDDQRRQDRRQRPGMISVPGSEVHVERCGLEELVEHGLVLGGERAAELAQLIGKAIQEGFIHVRIVCQSPR